jgi:Na+/pantothenate symporter
VLIPGITNPDLAIPKLVAMVLSPWEAALILAGVVAAGMSTFAGVLIIMSSSLVTDVYEHGLKRKLSGPREILANRVVSAAVGIISLVIALRPPALILVLTGFAWAVIASTNFWPLIFGLYWKGASKAGVVASMVVGSLMAIVWTWLRKPFGIDGFIAGALASLVVLVVITAIVRREPQADRA